MHKDKLAHSSLYFTFLIAFEKKFFFCSTYVLSPLTWFIHMKQTDLCSKGLFCMQLVTFPWQPMLVASKLEWSPVGGSNGVADKVNAPYGTSSPVISMEVFSNYLKSRMSRASRRLHERAKKSVLLSFLAASPFNIVPFTLLLP